MRHLDEIGKRIGGKIGIGTVAYVTRLLACAGEREDGLTQLRSPSVAVLRHEPWSLSRHVSKSLSQLIESTVAVIYSRHYSSIDAPENERPTIKSRLEGARNCGRDGTKRTKNSPDEESGGYRYRWNLYRDIQTLVEIRRSRVRWKMRPPTRKNFNRAFVGRYLVTERYLATFNAKWDVKKKRDTYTSVYIFARIAAIFLFFFV